MPTFHLHLPSHWEALRPERRYHYLDAAYALAIEIRKRRSRLRYAQVIEEFLDSRGEWWAKWQHLLTPSKWTQGPKADPDSYEAKQTFMSIWDNNARTSAYAGVKIPFELVADKPDVLITYPLDAFSKKELDELSKIDEDDEIFDEILYSDVTRRSKIENLHDLITDVLQEDMERSENHDPDYGESPPPDNFRMPEYQDRTVLQVAQDTLNGMDYEGDVWDLVGEYFSDTDAWDVKVEEWADYEEGPGIQPIPRHFKIDRWLFWAADEADAGELQEAVDQAAEDYDNQEIRELFTKGWFDSLARSAGAFTKLDGEWHGEYIYERLDPTHAVYWTPRDNWLDDFLGWARDRDPEGFVGDETQFESDEEPEDEEDRIVYTFEDGAYLLRMIPEDLPETGEELGQCIADPSHQYGSRLKAGDIELYSLRTPGGRPKFTIEIGLGSGKMTPGRNVPAHVGQILGKGNRHPGTGGKKVKWMEVQKLGKALEVLGFDPETDAPSYLGRAHAEMEKLDDPQARKLTQNPGWDDLSEEDGWYCPEDPVENPADLKFKKTSQKGKYLVRDGFTDVGFLTTSGVGWYLECEWGAEYAGDTLSEAKENLKENLEDLLSECSREWFPDGPIQYPGRDEYRGIPDDADVRRYHG
jgi:hypothetical protein